MAKLQNFVLSVAIMGTIMSSVTAASPYRMEELIKSSDLSNQQIHELNENRVEEINRNKRGVAGAAAATVGVASGVVGLIDSYKNNGIVKDIVHAYPNAVDNYNKLGQRYCNGGYYNPNTMQCV